MLRLIMATPISLVATVGLFSFMAWIVAPKHAPDTHQVSPLRFDMIMVESESITERRKRTVPKPPEPIEPPPATALSKPVTQAAAVSSLEATSLSIEMPSIDLASSVKGIEISLPAPTAGESTMDQKAMPLHRVEPNYPSRALRRGVEGHVIMNFSIDELGKPFDIVVVEGKPPRQFEREAVQALKRWKYQPKIVNQASVVQHGQSVKLEFRLSQ
ncbi:energy transducer TonB [Vibrio genomosp. F10 str. 9ZC157]|uniref:energy transducer TonB n=1 Tax=Vibrio genomosp. F10 TaxID=723171 RepID=UPI000372B133|nr:energy transducer TonB [Vibrio genomosp. F10]OEE93756.1 hypothetical protein A1QM_08220 [Vibrio genomosp. F10 str. 9ZC157]